MTGQQIHAFLAETLPAGWHRTQWNGRDHAGQSLPAGIYFSVLRARLQNSGEGMIATRKLALIR